MPVETAELSYTDLETMAQQLDQSGDGGDDSSDSMQVDTGDHATGTDTEANTAATQAGAKEQPEISSDTTDVPKPDASGKQKESKFKEAQRLDKTWKGVNAEKERIKQEREQFAREVEATRQELIALRQQQAAPPKPIAPAVDEMGNTAEKWDEFADKLERDGDFDKADLARARAVKLRSNGNHQPPVAPEKPASQVDYTPEQWQQVVAATVQAVPELADPEGPLGKDVRQLIAAEPLFSKVADGFSKAVAVAKLRQDAALVPELKKQVETQKAEIERLNKLTSLGGSNPNSPIRQRNFDQLTPEEQYRELESLSMSADRGD